MTLQLFLIEGKAKCCSVISKRKKMDLSRFSDEDFEVKEWVNAALNVHKEKQASVDVRHL